jgi:hypothetical protein
MNAKVYNSSSLKQRCDRLITKVSHDIIAEIMAQNKITSYEEAYLLYIRSLDTQKVQQCITEAARRIKNDFTQALVNLISFKK